MPDLQGGTRLAGLAPYALTNPTAHPHFWRLLLGVEIGVGVGIIVLIFGGTAFALNLEQQDSFCASCHTQPEVRYYDQANAARPATLAAAHAHEKSQAARCIDCHSGAGAFGRLVGLNQGAHDLISYLSGRSKSPAVTTNPLTDASCIKCHSDTVPAQVLTAVQGTRNHYHLYLPYWHQLDDRAARCADCHTAHTTGNTTDHFVNNGAAAIVCENCHRALSGKATR